MDKALNDDPIVAEATVTKIDNNQAGRSLARIGSFAKAMVLVPSYFLLMSSLKVLDKKDRLSKKGKVGYYF